MNTLIQTWENKELKLMAYLKASAMARHLGLKKPTLVQETHKLIHEVINLRAEVNKE
jgi:hypothetical protein